MIFSLYLPAQVDYTFEPRYEFGQDTFIEIQQVIRDSNGGYYAQGFISSINQRLDNTQIATIVLRLSCDGHPIWCRTISDTFDGQNTPFINRSHLWSINITTSKKGNLVLVDNYHTVSVSTFNPTGHLLHSKKLLLGPVTRNILFEIRDLDSGGFVLLGMGTDYKRSVPEYSFLMRLDENLNSIWSYRIEEYSMAVIESKTTHQLMVNNDTIYTIFNPRTKHVGLLSMDINGNILFAKEYPESFYSHKGALFYSGKDILLINSLLNQEYYDLQMRLIDPVTGAVKIDKAIKHTVIRSTRPFLYISGFIHPPTCLYDQNNKKWICFGSETFVNTTYPYGHPFYLELDDSLCVTAALKVGEDIPVQDMPFDSIIYNGFASLYHNELVFPLVRNPTFYPFFANLNKPGILMTDKAFQDLSCIKPRDILDSIAYIPTPQGPVLEYKKGLSRGPSIADHRISGGFIYPRMSYNCYDRRELTPVFLPHMARICQGDTLQLNSIANYGVKAWSWYRDQTLLGVDSVIHLSFDSIGKYPVELVISDGCYEYSTVDTIVVAGPDTVFLDYLICRGDTLRVDSLSISSEGSYEIHGISSIGCDSTTILEVKVEQAATSVDTTLCEGETFIKDGYEIATDTLLIDTLQTVHFCDSIVTYSIHFKADCDKCKLRFPLAFTPNRDQLNDDLGLINPCNIRFESFELSIYSRWGQKVFMTHNPQERWDGSYKSKPMNSEVYLVRLQGITSRGEPIRITTDITLVR